MGTWQVRAVGPGLRLPGVRLTLSDSAAVSDDTRLTVTAKDQAEVLLFDLP